LTSGAPNYNINGEIIGSIGIHLDITEQKRAGRTVVLSFNCSASSRKSGINASLP
jgi:hypothetical protein